MNSADLSPQTPINTIHSFLLFDSQNGGDANAHWGTLLSNAYPEIGDLALHDQLLVWANLSFRNREQELKLHGFVEYFAGCGSLAKSCLTVGMEGVRFDKAYDEKHNVLTPTGLRLWLDELAATRAGALIWLGTLCSPFLFLCRCQSKRSVKNGYLGDDSVNWVCNGNNMMRASALIFFIASLIFAEPMLEQPVNSVMPKCAPLKTVFQFLEATRTMTWLGAYGGASPKPIQLMHLYPIYANLRREKPKGQEFQPLVTKKKGKVTGKKEELKNSQEYPTAFAEEVASLTELRLCGTKQ